jgi:hypothetical protein
MFRYDDLRRHPTAFPSLTGLNRAEFDELVPRFERAERAVRARSGTTRREGKPRVNAPGAGPRHAHAACNRLLMALVWLRVYPTYEVLGFFFGLHKRNAQLNVRSALAALDSLDDFPFDRPSRERPKMRSAAEVMAAFPQVRLVIDGKEQRVNRPHGHDAQRPYYSGKKKAHTVKAQVAIDTRGRIESISPSVPGGANHDLALLRGSGVLESLAEGEAAMLDRGYVGVGNYYPGVPVVIPFRASKGRPLTDDQRARNRLIAQYRIVVEHTMAQLNRFTVLRQVFRGQKRERHGEVIRVVGKLVNRRLAVKPLKTYAA